MNLLQKFQPQKLQLVALIALAIYPLAILAARLDIWHFRNSFLLFVLAALVGFAVLVIAILKLAKAGEGEAKPLAITIAATALPLAILGNSIFKAQNYPFIHDISTDTQTPPTLAAAAKDRVEGDHDVTYEGTEIAELQKQGYPELTSLNMSQTPDQVFKLAHGLVVKEGWQVLAENAETLPYTIEAVDSSLLFGFKDDVVIRIQSTENGSVVDMRSMSRQGKSDLGVNAKRISLFFDQLVR